MTERAVFTALAEILEVPNEGHDAATNPYLTIARFVFTDDKGAPLSTALATGKQGIELEDFDEIIRTAIDMPVKMNFTGTSAANHGGSYVIGHMKNMAKIVDGTTNKLVAEAVLYNEEYRDEVNYLKKAFADGEAPGISYEIAYGSSIIKEGVEWIKEVTTCAATFVGSPAYGTRTALLALASSKDDEEFVQTMKTLVAQAESKKIPTPSNEGGKNVEELEKAKEEVAKFKAEAETKTAEISKLTEAITAKDTEITTLKDQITAIEREKMVETRNRRFTEAGFKLEADAEKADKKKAFWLTLSDESFDEYLADLVDAKGMSKEPEDKKLAAASLRSTLPRPDVNSDGPTIPSFNFRD